RGDAAAREELLGRAWGRLERLTRKMLGGFPVVRQLEWTGAVLDASALRLYNALGKVGRDSAPHFYPLVDTPGRRAVVRLAVPRSMSAGSYSTGPAAAGAIPPRPRGAEAVTPPSRRAASRRTTPPATRSVWTDGPTFTRRSSTCRTSPGRRSICSGTRGCLR